MSLLGAADEPDPSGQDESRTARLTGTMDTTPLCSLSGFRHFSDTIEMAVVPSV